MGGKSSPINGKGYFVEPTVFTDVKPSMSIWQEEVFGPFVAIATFDDEAEAIALANSSTYGLGASVFTENLQRAHRVAAALEAGMVWINSSQDSDPRIVSKLTGKGFRHLRHMLTLLSITFSHLVA
jgi:aldehyde dehydrogenase (NAD(P)+)